MKPNVMLAVAGAAAVVSVLLITAAEIPSAVIGVTAAAVAGVGVAVKRLLDIWKR